MHYFYRFFPYRSLYHIDENSLTAYWVVATILIFLSLLIYLIIKTVTMRDKLSSLVESFSLKSCRQCNWLQKLCEEYFRTFLALDGDRKKTFESSSNYFNDQNILHQYLNLRFWYMVPGTLVGFGILGTFVGLTVGISEFNINTIDNIKKSIQTLLSGMGTAFVSSVWGMLLSILFSVAEKSLFKDISRLTKTLSDTLDHTFRLKKTDELRIIKEDQEDALKKFLVFKDQNNQEVLPGQVLRDLQQEAGEQTRTLKSFSTELADGIKISAETVEALGSHLARAISRPLQEDLAPLLQRIEAAIQEVRAAKEESSGEIIERVMSELRQTLAGMGGNFQEALTGSVSEQINRLASIIRNAGATLADFPARQQAMMGTIDAQVLKIGESLAKMMIHMEDGILKQREMMHDSCVKADEAGEKAIKRMNDETNNATELMRKNITLIQGKTLEILNKQEEISRFIKNILFNYADILKQGSDFNNELNKTIYKLSLSNSTLSKISANFTDISVKIGDGIDIIQKTINKYQDYNVVVEDNLGEFSTNLAQAVKSLKNSTEELQEIVQKLAVTKIRLVK